MLSLRTYYYYHPTPPPALQLVFESQPLPVAGVRDNIFYMRWEPKPHAQTPTWRVRVSAWYLPQNIACKDGPTTSQAADGAAFEFDGACKLNLPLTSGGTIQGDLEDRTVLVSLKQYSLSALRNRAHSFSLLTALFLEPRKGPYICKFPLYTQLTFLILAAFKGAILHPTFSILPIHHYASQFLKSSSSTFCTPCFSALPFHHSVPSTSISHFTTSYMPELGFI